LEFAKFCKLMGYPINIDNELQMRKSFNELMERTQGDPNGEILQQMAIRTMSKAVYTAYRSDHFGLAFEHYTHFTSPIRRYPDLLVHRTIKAILAKKNYKPTIPEDVPLNLSMPRKGPGRVNAAQVKQQIATDQSNESGVLKSRKKTASDGIDIAAWAQLGVHCSANERRADEASRDVESWLKCYFMRDRLGQEFAGTITGATTFGLFVQLETLFVEGLIHVSELGGDYFQYDEARQELRGERTGIRYRIGDRVHVLVSRVDLDARKIEFSLVKNNQDKGRYSPLITVDDSGKPQKKAASKNTRPPEKAPQPVRAKTSKKSVASKGGNKSKAKSNAKRSLSSVDKAEASPAPSNKSRSRR
jgi:ribonuclease R